jgi:hypothetical protein
MTQNDYPLGIRLSAATRAALDRAAADVHTSAACYIETLLTVALERGGYLDDTIKAGRPHAAAQ